MRSAVALALAVTALAFAADALACSCEPVVLARDLPRVEGAFVGTLLERREPPTSSATRSDDPVTLVFRVEQVYKGAIENRVEVQTVRGGDACGISIGIGDRTGLLLDRDGAVWRSTLCSQVDPAEFLALTDVKDNELPPLNWGGIVVGVLVLLSGGYFLLRRLRR